MHQYGEQAIIQRLDRLIEILERLLEDKDD
jgi:hypothetical protein